MDPLDRRYSSTGALTIRATFASILKRPEASEFRLFRIGFPPTFIDPRKSKKLTFAATSNLNLDWTLVLYWCAFIRRRKMMGLRFILFFLNT